MSDVFSLPFFLSFFLSISLSVPQPSISSASSSTSTFSSTSTSSPVATVSSVGSTGVGVSVITSTFSSRSAVSLSGGGVCHLLVSSSATPSYQSLSADNCDSLLEPSTEESLREGSLPTDNCLLYTSPSSPLSSSPSSSLFLTSCNSPESSQFIEVSISPFLPLISQIFPFLTILFCLNCLHVFYFDTLLISYFLFALFMNRLKMNLTPLRGPTLVTMKMTSQHQRLHNLDRRRRS